MAWEQFLAEGAACCGTVSVLMGPVVVKADAFGASLSKYVLYLGE